MWRLAGLFGALGMEMAIAVILGTWGGERLDRFFDVSPWGALAGFGIGLGAAVLGLRRAMVQARLLLNKKTP